MTIRLGWTPEFGGALGPPFPLPTLALIKAGTCLVVFSPVPQDADPALSRGARVCARAAEARRRRAAPALSGPHVALAQAVPLRQIVGRPRGLLVVLGLRRVVQPEAEHATWSDAFLGLCLTGLTVVDVSGPLSVRGPRSTNLLFVSTPGVDYDTDESGSESSSSSDSDGEGHELLRRRRDVRGGSPGGLRAGDAARDSTGRCCR